MFSFPFIGTCSIVKTSFGYFDFQPPGNSTLQIVGTVLNVTCNPGYGPYKGIDYAVCGPHFRWEPFSPYCDGKQGLYL